jgi:hypothetical protein
MASVKLTNYIRDRIVDDLLEHRFKDFYAETVKALAGLADRVYKDVYDASARRKISHLPEGWLPEANCIGAQFGEGDRGYTQLDFDGMTHVDNLRASFRPRVFVNPPREFRRVLSKHKGGCAAKYPKAHELSQAWFTIANGVAEQHGLHAEARKLARRGVEQVTTIGKLIEVWPEVEQFARRHVGAGLGVTDRTLPVPQLAALNTALRLPPGAHELV